MLRTLTAWGGLRQSQIAGQQGKHCRSKSHALSVTERFRAHSCCKSHLVRSLQPVCQWTVMINAIFQTLLGCHHRRLTWPTTPVRKPGAPSGETSVVCLDCGKQFAYDWNHMRIGKPIEQFPDSGVLPPNTPGPGKAKIKYALIGSAISFAIFLGRALIKKRRGRTPAAFRLKSAARQMMRTWTGASGCPIASPARGFRFAN